VQNETDCDRPENDRPRGGVWTLDERAQSLVTFFKTLDVTPLISFSRKRGYKFNMLLCWCIGRAASGIKAFYILPVGRELPRYDSIAVNTIVKNKTGEVSSCDVPFSNLAFFREKIGKRFSFHVLFQKWLKANAEKTYGDAILAYDRLLEEKKRHKPEIGGQFEYNTYIRDFFADNPGKSLRDAIVCWNYKKLNWKTKTTGGKLIGKK